MSALRFTAVAGFSVLSSLGSLASAAEKLLVVNSTSHGSVELVDVGTGDTTQINSDRLHFPRGAVLDLGGDLIVTARHEIRRYLGAMSGQSGDGVLVTNAIHRPDGPSLDPATGDLYVVGRSRHHSGLFRLRRDPQTQGGFAPAEPVGHSLSWSLSDTRVGAEGDVLVLSKNPAAIFRFVRRGDGFRRTPKVFTKAFPRKARPTGMTFSVGTAGIEILVSDARGAIHRFSASGERLGALNDLSVHAGFRQVTTSLASNQPVVYASLLGGTVLKFALAGDGTAVNPAGEAIPADFSRPDGLGALAVAPTLPGDHVVVRPAFGVELKFDHIESPGFTSAELSFVPPLTSSNRIPDGVIPPVDGDPRIPLLRLDTTAEFTGTFQLHGDEEALLAGGGGELPELAEQLAQPSELVRWMFAPELGNGEPPIAECDESGCDFVDITDGLGSHVGRGWGFSEFITVRDTRGDELTRIGFKLDGLRATLANNSTTLGELREDLDAKVNAYAEAMGIEGSESFDADAAANLLDDFMAEVVSAAPPLPNAAPTNLEGELVARARALKFSTCTFLVSDPQDLNACVAE